MNTALEYSTRVVQEGGRRCKKSTLDNLVHPWMKEDNLVHPWMKEVISSLSTPDPSKNTFNEPANI
jgi:hypothetical protein